MSSQVQRVNTDIQVSNHNNFDSPTQSQVSSSNEGSSHTTGISLPITGCTSTTTSGGGANGEAADDQKNERAYSVDREDDFSDMPFRTIQRNLLSHGITKTSLSTEDSYYSGSDESTHHLDVYRFYHDDLHDMLRNKNLEIKTDRELDTIVVAIIHPYPDQSRTKFEKLQLIRHNSHKLLEKERFQRTFQHYRTFNESHYTNLYRLYSNENLNIRGMLKHFHTKANMGSSLAQWFCGIFFLVNEKQICHVIRKLWTNQLPIPGLDRTFFEIIQEAIMDDQLYLLDVIIPLIKFINNQLLRAPQISLPLIQPNSSYAKAFRGSKLNLTQLRQIETGKVYKTAMYLSTCKTMKEARKFVGPNNIYVVFHMPTNCKYIGTLLGQNDEHVIIPPYTSVRVKKIRNMDKHYLLIVQLFDNEDLPEHQTTILL